MMYSSHSHKSFADKDHWIEWAYYEGGEEFIEIYSNHPQDCYVQYGGAEDGLPYEAADCQFNWDIDEYGLGNMVLENSELLEGLTDPEKTKPNKMYRIQVDYSASHWIDYWGEHDCDIELKLIGEPEYLYDLEPTEESFGGILANLTSSIKLEESDVLA